MSGYDAKMRSATIITFMLCMLVTGLHQALAIVPAQLDGQVYADNEPFIGAEVKAYIDGNGNGIVDEGVYTTTQSLDISEPAYFRIIIEPDDFEEGVTDIILTSRHENMSAYLYVANITEGTTFEHDLILMEASMEDDSDGDGVPDKLDICPMTANPDQGDLDNDGLGDACDDDDDGDDVPDTEDTIRGNASTIETNIGCLSMMAVIENETLEEPCTCEGLGTMIIQTCEGMPLAEFQYNFTNSSPLKLDEFKLLHEEGEKGNMISFNGLSDYEGTKTLYIENGNNISTICIKDSHADPSEMSSLCRGSDETGLTCPGDKDGYNCTISEGMLVIEGLTHSTIRQQSYCGDGSCDNGAGESCSTCARDCGSCSSSSGGGGGDDDEDSTSTSSSSSSNLDPDFRSTDSDGTDTEETDNQEECEPSWDCTDWSSCADGIQTRECTDINECGTEDGMPIQRRACPGEGSGDNETITTSDSREDAVQQQGMEGITGAVTGGGNAAYWYVPLILAILVIAGLFGYRQYMASKKPRPYKGMRV